MADPAAVPAAEAEDELVDYEEDVDGGDADADKAVQAKSTKGSYVGAAAVQAQILLMFCIVADMGELSCQRRRRSA